MRNSKAILAGFLAGALILSGSASARVWGAPSDWVVASTDDGESCGFTRDFEGAGGSRVIVLQDADGPISLAVSNYEWNSLKEGTSVAITVVLGNKSYEADATAYKSGIYRGLMFSLDEEQLQAFAAAPFMRIYRKDTNTLIDGLTLDGTGAAVQLMRRCLVSVRAALARKRAEEARLAHIPKDPFAPPAMPSEPPKPRQPVPNGNIVSLFSDEDYPASAVRAGEQGRVAYRLTVGANGRVTQCVITSSSGSAVLDATTCRLIRARARFSPALLSNERPQSGTFDGVITWRLPDDEPAATTVTPRPPGSPERGD